MKKLAIFLVMSGAIAFQSCIGEDILNDIVNEEIRFINPIDSLQNGDSHQLEVLFLDASGQEISAEVTWESLDETRATVSGTGLLTAVGNGSATIVASARLANVKGDREFVSDSITIGVADFVESRVDLVDVRKTTIRTTSSYVLKGEGVLKKNDSDQLVLELDASYEADRGLPGLVVYLTNNPNTNNGALRIADVTVFSGAHSYIIPTNPAIDQYSHVLYYCEPFTVKVGDGALAE